MREGTVAIGTDGTLRFLHDGDLRELLLEGNAKVFRASRVEPEGTGWTADLSPVCGPTLGPFATKEEAVAAETAWLTEHLL